MIDLDQLIAQANEMQPLPASTVRLAQMITEPRSHLEDVVELIAFDQALTVKLLRAANSASNSAVSGIGTVQEAVMRLGMAQVLALAVAGATKPLLRAQVPAYGLSEGALWRHSVAAAVAAEVAGGICKVEVPRETFTAALLHDVGKLVMSRFLSPEVLDYIRRAQEIDHLGQLEAEAVLLSVNHGELGGLIAQHWQLPPRVVQGIIYHHAPDEGLDVICHLTCLANQVAKVIEAGLDGQRADITVPPEVCERLGLDSATLDRLCTSASTRFDQVSRRYNAL
jgi:HD-like signal output (HDOD) protein